MDNIIQGTDPFPFCVKGRGVAAKLHMLSSIAAKTFPCYIRKSSRHRYEKRESRQVGTELFIPDKIPDPVKNKTEENDIKQSAEHRSIRKNKTFWVKRPANKHPKKI